MLQDTLFNAMSLVLVGLREDGLILDGLKGGVMMSL